MAQSTAAGGKTKGRGYVIFLTGLVLGVLGTLLLPGLLRPYLPASLQGSDDTVSGLVTAKERQDDKLLLTVDSQRGAVLATFSKKVAEISLLVDAGDSVALAVRTVEPFVEDPAIREVHKTARRQPPAMPPADTETTPKPAATGEDPMDTARAADPIEPPPADADTAVSPVESPEGTTQ